MLDRIKAIKYVLKRKNSQIRAEREKLLAAEAANKILSAYIAVIAYEEKRLSVPKDRISTALLRYKAEISADGDNYIIEVKEDKKMSLGNGAGSGGK